MLVGVPKEIKDNEFRVGMTPAAVAELVHHGHQVIVEVSAGLGSGSPDEEYIRAGGKIVATGADVFAQGEMIVKVKEPLAEERKRLKRGQILFTYLHLAPDLEQTRDLMASRRKSGRMRWRRRKAGAACCSAACRAWPPPTCLCSAAACRAPMRRRLRSAWAPP
jgi:alanine dehydrogenase